MFVESSSYDLINTLEHLSVIYPYVQKLYPDVKSLHLTQTSFAELIKTNKIEVYSIEVNNDN